MSPALSIVVPAYNEAPRIGATVERIVEWCRVERPSFEVIVVDDGSTDGTAEIVRAVVKEAPEVLHHPMPRNSGKGAAVRAGVLAARGERILFSDADLATPIEDIAKLEAALDAGAGVAIGSRAMSGAHIEVHQHPIRELLGRSFNAAVRLLVVDGIADTQCGFKLFTRAAARDVFGRATIDGYGFDVELLWLARGHHRVVEVPVVWRHVGDSKLRPGIDGVHMLADLARIRWRHRGRR